MAGWADDEIDETAVRQRLRQVVAARPAAPTPPCDSAPATAPEAPALALSAWSAFDPGRRGVKALAAVAVLVVLVAGFLAWRARPRAEPVAPPVPVSATPGASAPAGPQGTVAETVVAVTGKVRRPGLVRLSPGARVADAIEAAGGVLPGTDLTLLNLARKVTDGELIAVGVPAPAVVGGAPAGGAPPAGPGAGGPGAGGPAAGEKVNLNTATLAQLDSLPGVGPVLAQRILDYRTSHGGFKSTSELRQVDGIGDSRFEQLKELVTV